MRLPLSLRRCDSPVNADVVAAVVAVALRAGHTVTISSAPGDLWSHFVLVDDHVTVTIDADRGSGWCTHLVTTVSQLL
jgi:hypothetical protein